MPAGALLGLLTLAQLPTLANSVGFQIALGTGLHRRAAVLSVGEGLSKVLLAVFLVPRLGVSGVVLSSLVASTVANAILWPRVLRAHLRVGMVQFASAAIAPAAWPLLPALMAGGLAERFLGHEPHFYLLPPLVAGSVYFGTALWSNRADLRHAYAGSADPGSPRHPDGQRTT
jgi:O-antigen/teichoic acid export membrane protein